MDESKTVLFNDLTACRQKSGVGCYAAQLLRHLSQNEEGPRVLPLSQTLAGAPLRSASQWYDAARKAPANQQHNPTTAPAQSHPLVGAIRKYGHVALDAYVKTMARWIRCGLYHEPDAVPLSISAPTVSTVHDLSVLMFPNWHPQHRVEKYERYLQMGLDRTTCFVAVSESTKRDMVTHLGLPADMIHVVPEAPRPEFQVLPQASIDPVLQSLGLDKPYLLYVGTIEPRKNVVGLLRAYAMLPSSLRSEYPLVLAGGWGWRSEPVRQMLTQAPWSEDVRWVGYLDDSQLVAVMNAATALVYPSFYEGFGLPPLEAMACQTPVITTHAGSLAEVVQDAAIIVHPEDEIDLAKAMRGLLIHHEIREEYVRRGSEHVLKFNWEQTAQATREVYRKVA